MKFEDMVPLIQRLTAARSAKDLAKKKLDIAKHKAPPGRLAIAEEYFERARDEWWDAVTATEEGWARVLEPLPIDRHDLRMAAL